MVKVVTATHKYVYICDTNSFFYSYLIFRAFYEILVTHAHTFRHTHAHRHKAIEAFFLCVSSASAAAIFHDIIGHACVN